MPYFVSGGIGLAFSILICIYLFSSSLCKYAILGALGALGSGRGALDIVDASIFPSVPSEVVKIVDNLLGSLSNAVNKDECLGSRITMDAGRSPTSVGACAHLFIPFSVTRPS